MFGLCTAGKGRALLVTASLDRTVRVFEPTRGGGCKCLHVLAGHTVREVVASCNRPIARRM